MRAKPEPEAAEKEEEIARKCQKASNFVKKMPFAVVSGDYFVVKFVRTYSMYYSTPPCGGQITPCTDPKLRAKRDFNMAKALHPSLNSSHKLYEWELLVNMKIL